MSKLIHLRPFSSLIDTIVSLMWCAFQVKDKLTQLQKFIVQIDTIINSGF